MEIYSTEEQQVEAIKSWWRSNGTAVILGAVIGLGGLYGWRYYQNESLKSQEQASQSYSEALQKLSADGDDALAQVASQVESTQDSYSSLLALQLAKSFVEAKQLDKAAEQFTLIQQRDDEVLRQIATMRLSRILVELKEFDKALAELDKISDSSWKAQVEELRGDIKVEQGDSSAAAAFYAASIAAQTNPSVQMKLDNIAK